MDHYINNFIPINDILIPIVFFDMAGKNVLSIDNKDDLLLQVDRIAKLLKRKDYNKFVLMANEIQDANEILNIQKLFLEEDVYLVAVWVNKIDDEVKERLCEELESGVITPESTTLDNPKYLRYKKNYR